MEGALLRAFGTGAPVSLFTLGTMRCGHSSEQMDGVLRAALDAGVNHIETAPAYGAAESDLGLSLRRLDDEGLEPPGGWRITSKVLPGCTRSQGLDQLGESLRRLGRSQLSHWAVHGLNTPEHLDWALHGEGSELLQAALEEGLVQQVGFSSHGPIPVIRAALASGRFGFCSLHVHLFDQARLPLAEWALEKGIGVMATSPADKGGHLAQPSETLQRDCQPFTPLYLAYRFLLAFGISTLTLGASRPSDLGLARRLAGDGGPLRRDEHEALARLESAGRSRLAGSRCGQSRRCLPCPQSVPIPELLRLRNLDIGHGMESFARERYNLIGRAGHWWEQVDGSACRGCKACLPRCPHHLPIPELLAETHARLKAAPRRRLWG